MQRLAKQKSPARGGAFHAVLRRLLGDHANEFAILRAFHIETHLTISLCKNGVVLANSHVVTRMKARATLTHDDIAGPDGFTAKALNAEAF